jgi:predicted nucleotidyltransferase component of viral defense system
MIDKETLQDLAKELKIDLFTVSREYLQLLFLKYFYAQKESEKVYFKGGTALRFLFGSFRFSEDLDFTSLLSKNKLKILINRTIQNLKKEAGEISFKEEKTIANAFTGRLFQKLPEFSFPLTIRLDFSLREKPFLTEASYLETVFPVGPFPQISHLKIEELMAEKTRAILTRKRGRDIFDFYFLLSKKVPIDWKVVNKKMALYKKTADIKKLIEAIKNFPQEEIKEDLTKFLPLTHRDLVEKIKELTLEKLEDLA